MPVSHPPHDVHGWNTEFHSGHPSSTASLCLFKLNLGPVHGVYTGKGERALHGSAGTEAVLSLIGKPNCLGLGVPPAGTCPPAAQYSWIGKGNRLSKRVLHLRNSLLSGIPWEEVASWVLALLSQLSHPLQNPVDVEQRISME